MYNFKADKGQNMTALMGMLPQEAPHFKPIPPPWFFYVHQNTDLHIVIQEKKKPSPPGIVFLLEVYPEGLC